MYEYPTKIDEKHLLACLSEEASEITELCMEYTLGALDMTTLTDLYHEFVDLKTVYKSLIEHNYIELKDPIRADIEYTEADLPLEISKRCSKLIKAASKSIRFGIHNTYKESLNEEMIHNLFHEIDTLVYLFLSSLNFNLKLFNQRELISKKKQRIYHYYEMLNL